MSLRSLLNQTMDVRKVATRTVGVVGSVANKYADRLSDVPCRFQPLSSFRQLEFDKMQIPASHTVYFEQGTTLTVNDRIVHGGKNYEVVSTEYAEETGRPHVAIVAELTENTLPEAS